MDTRFPFPLDITRNGTFGSYDELFPGHQMGFPGGSEGKVYACSVGDRGLILGSGRSPGEGNGNPLQYSCLENPMDRGAWWATSPWGHRELDTTE